MRWPNYYLIFCLHFLLSTFSLGQESPTITLPMADDGTFLTLKKSDLAAGTHHTRHYEIFGKYISGINAAILKGIDSVQAHAPDGGGYFTGPKAKPPESPVGYDVMLFGKPLLRAPRRTSYCSGATYAALVEALNILLPEGGKRLSHDRLETLRMQEPDGSRRENMVKFWGKWNTEGAGCQFALVQYSGMGKEISPAQLRPGDFVNITWKKRWGHAVIFLGWIVLNGDKKMVFWSSQKATNGFGDQVVSLRRIKAIKAVRLTDLSRLFAFDINQPVTIEVPKDQINW
jgi:hypothetical protein